MNQQINRPLDPKGWMFFDLILKQYHPRDPNAIVALLTPDEQQRCHIKAPLSKLADWLDSCSVILATLHPQWIVDTIKTFEEKRQLALLAALPEPTCALVCELGKWQEPTTHVRSDFMNPILRSLLRKLQDNTYVPFSTLPKGVLSPLLDLSFSQLSNVIYCMGLRDLAEVVRGIVDKNLLHSIYGCLKPHEQKLLRSYIQQKERLKSTPLAVKTWDGKKETLRLLCYERGLIRTSGALLGQDSGFLWHLFHRFSPQEATQLQQQMHHRKPPVEVTNLLIQQLLGVIDSLQRQST